MKKTLVLYGSARKKGETREMLDLLLQEMGDKAGDVEIIDTYHTDVAPCTDCRYCWKKRGCSIKDGMQEIYEKVDAADLIILAAPVYFNSIPGKMKVMVDRFQVYWASAVRNDRPQEPAGKGAALFVGGAPAFDTQFDGAALVAKGIFHDFALEDKGMITFSDTDKQRVAESPETIGQIRKLAADLTA